MSTPIVIESSLAADPAAVWARVSTMEGVNGELWPILYMTFPAHAAKLDDPTLHLGTVAFRSWLLAGCVFPIDRHALRLLSITPGESFHEESSSWLQRRWTHTRSVVPRADGGSIVRDEVDFSPSLSFLRPVIRPLVVAVFRWRHRRLRARFGVAR